MFDLHIHTNASDGEFSPKEIIKMAKTKGLSAISITDHDSIENLEEAILIGKEENIEVIPGIELNANVDSGQMHILGYYIDYNNPVFKKKVEHIREEKNLRNIEFASTFNKIGINISLENVEKHANNKIVSRAHFAQELYDKNYTDSINEAYSKYFNTVPFKNIKNHNLSPKDTIKTIKEANGIAVLAHPQTLKLNEDELDKTLEELKSYGLDGIECYHSKQTEEQRNLYAKLAKKHNLLITAGSDFHGPTLKPEIKMGINSSDNLFNKTDIISELKNKVPSNSVFKNFSI